MSEVTAETIKQSQVMEIPVVLDCIDQDDNGTRFRFAYEGQAYDMIGPRMTQLDFYHLVARLCQ